MKSNLESTINIVHNIIYMTAPWPNSYSTLILNSKLSGVLNVLDMKSSNYNLETNGSSVKQNKQCNEYLTKNTYINLVKKTKHFPPANKEWVNSTCVYNNTTKDLPMLDKMLTKLIKSYFNLYNNKLRTKIRKHGSRRFEIRKSRRLMNRVFISKPELKHNNDSVVITVYLYNVEKKYIVNKIKNIPAIYKLSTLNKFNKLNEESKLAISKMNKAKIIYLQKTNRAGANIKSKLSNHKKNFFISKKLKASSKNFLDINNYKKRFIKSYAKKFLRREIVSTFYKQMLTFNKQKFEKRYVIHLANNIAKMYNKKIEFNFVSLKHIYLDSQIFSTGLIAKLKRLARIKKSFLKGLKQFLSMFRVPRVNTLHTYNEIFNRQMLSQNINNNNILLKKNSIDAANGYKMWDLTDGMLNIEKLISKTDLNNFKYLTTMHYTSVLSKAFDSIKYKIINGVRLEIAGRFTKRSSAARSVFKIRNKGSIKNKDSSNKGLPAVLLKGYAKSNLQYNKVYSKVRGGSFGIKGWLSGA